MSYHPGQNIHSADTQCIGVLFVKSGCLRVYIMSEEGKEVTLYRVNPGEVCILTASCVLSEITFDDLMTFSRSILVPPFRILKKKFYLGIILDL